MRGCSYISNQGVQQWTCFQHVTAKFFIFHNLSVFISKPKIHEKLLQSIGFLKTELPCACFGTFSAYFPSYLVDHFIFHVVINLVEYMVHFTFLCLTLNIKKISWEISYVNIPS